MKGTMIPQFDVGQHVEFHTDIGSKVYAREEDPHTGKQVDVFVRNVHIDRVDTGRIVKLHKSGSRGVAEIVPDVPMPKTDSRKVSRRLQHVQAVAV